MTTDHSKCQYCGQYHSTVCPSVKAIDYYEDGSVKRVEFKTANDYPRVSMGDMSAPTFPYAERVAFDALQIGKCVLTS